MRPINPLSPGLLGMLATPVAGRCHRLPTLMLLSTSAWADVYRPLPGLASCPALCFWTLPGRHACRPLLGSLLQHLQPCITLSGTAGCLQCPLFEQAACCRPPQSDPDTGRSPASAQGLPLLMLKFVIMPSACTLCALLQLLLCYLYAPARHPNRPVQPSLATSVVSRGGG